MKRLVLLFSVLSLLVLAACSTPGLTDDQRLYYAAAETTCVGLEALSAGAFDEAALADMQEQQLAILEKYGFSSMEEFQAANEALVVRMEGNPELTAQASADLEAIMLEVCPEVEELQGMLQ